MTKTEKVPILGIFSPKTILMFMVGLNKLGRETGTTHIFHLSLNKKIQCKIITIFQPIIFSIWFGCSREQSY